MAKKPAPKDWHRAEIVAAIHMKGSSLRKLSAAHGYKGAVLANALRYPAPLYERLIAEFIGEKQQTIWASRYHVDGTPKSGRGERGLGRYKAKFNASKAKRNANLTRSA